MNIYSSVMHEVLNTRDKKLSPHHLVKKGLKEKKKNLQISIEGQKRIYKDKAKVFNIDFK